MLAVVSLLVTLDLLVVAHRGASAVAPENTLAAFKAAGTAGADMYELDVRTTKDGELVVLHDSTLERTTDAEELYPDRAPWRVSDFTLAEIRRLDAGKWFGPRFAGQRVPTLAEAIEAMRTGPAAVVVEVKKPTPEIEPRLADVLAEAPSDTIVQSFDWEFVRRLQTHALRAVLGTVPAARLPYVAGFADYVNVPHQTVTPAYVKTAHRLGLKVMAYTVNRPRVMRRMLAAGVDGLLTNKPRAARRVADMTPIFDELRNVLGEMKRKA
ncbi:glycerophosphodiester phosphodiesterase family protein [Nonomuraea sp. NPDC050310]|uniref:glycerophosphodiester phosphodiesterase n=1 Tax=unclassified Nonomuraea TaxID=2593643 RepID=UPI0033DB499A